MAGSKNTGNEYQDDFDTNNYSEIDDNNFVYVNQSKKFDKDVWNYNTKQISLYIENLKKIIEFDDKKGTIPTIAGVKTINGTVFNTNRLEVVPRANASSEDKDCDGILLKDNTGAQYCTRMNLWGNGPAFNVRSQFNPTWVSVDNWKNGIEGCAIYHNGDIFTSTIHVRDITIEGQIYSNSGTIGGMFLRNDRIGYNVAGYNCIFGSGSEAPQQMRTNWIYSDTGYGGPSDKKLKNHIKNLTIDKTFLDFFMNIKPVEFIYKNKEIYGNRKHIGLYAQDLFQNEEKTIGDFVSCKAISNQKDLLKNKEDRIKILNNEISDEDIDWSLDYSRLVTPTIAVVQYQQKEIENLKKEVNELKQIISNK